jgi:hypothetical protein
MLFAFTSTIDYIGFSIALWLAFYLLARGFPSRVTMRTVVVLLALATFFLSAAINLHLRIPGATSIRAILLILALSTWHDLTNKLLPQKTQKNTRWLVSLIYFFGLFSVVLLFGTRNAFVGETSNILYVGRMNLGPTYVIYGIFQVIASLAILNSFRLGAKYGVGDQNRFFLIASIIAISTVGYGIFALALTPPMPRLIQDALILVSIILLGISTARYQTFLERRTTIQDFPVSILAVFSLSAVFAALAWFWSSSPVLVILITALSILTHAFYDMVREFLDRLRYKSDSEFHHQLRQLERIDREGFSLQDRLSKGLSLLCEVISASGGFIAIKEEEQFVVSVTHHSVRIGLEIPAFDVIGDDIQRPNTRLLKDIDWIAPALENGEQIAIIGIRNAKTKNEYSTDDIDLLAEVADRIGSIVYHQTDRTGELTRSGDRAPDFRSRQESMDSGSDDLFSTLVTNPDPEFVKLVEDGMRNLSDYVKLGESSLVEYLNINGETQLERGKMVHHQLVQAIDILKPDKQRPSEPLPREWYNYVVLHDAYVEDLPNREIMARLYVSEGTFNRSRRNALRGVARFLFEKSRKK